MDILDFFWTFYLNHLSPLWGYFCMHLTLFNQVQVDVHVEFCYIFS